MAKKKKKQSAADRKLALTEKKVNTQATKNAADKKANANKRSQVKTNNPISNSSASRVSQANKILNKNKNSIDPKTYSNLQHKVNQAAARHTGDWDGMKMITQSGFSKKMQENLKANREAKGRKAIGDTDYNNKGEGNRGSAAKTTAKSTKPKTQTRKTETANNRHQTDEARSRMATRQAAKDKNLTDVLKARRNFNTKDTNAFASAKSYQKARDGLDAAYKKAQSDPSQANVDAFEKALSAERAAAMAFRTAADERENALIHYQHKARFGKGNIDLTDLPKNEKGRTETYDSEAGITDKFSFGLSKFNQEQLSKLPNAKKGSDGTTDTRGKSYVYHDKDTGEYVLIPNYYKDIETGEWVRLNDSSEAIARYKESGRYLGKFKSEQEANNYASDLRKSQSEALNDTYMQAVAGYNDVKNEAKKTKAAFKEAKAAYEAAQAGGNEKEITKAKKAMDKARTAFEKADEAKDKYKKENPDATTDWTALGQNVLRQGATEVAYQGAGFAEMVVNLFDKDNDNAVSRFTSYLNGQLQRQAEYGQTRAGTNKIAAGVNKFGPTVVSMIPTAIMAILSVGGTAGAATAQALSEAGHVGRATASLARTAATAAGQVGKAESLMAVIGQGLWSYAHDPQFEASFVQVSGQSYADAIEDGYSESQALSQALINATLASIIEVGEVGGAGLFGGINKFNKAKKLLAEGDYRQLYKFAKTAGVGEAAEEVVQGITERTLQKATLGADNPLFSTEDPNAIINPNTMKDEALGGLIGGAIMGGGMATVSGGINYVNDVRSGARQNEVSLDIIDSALEYEEGSKTRAMAEKLAERRRQAIKETGTRTKTGDAEFNQNTANDIKDTSNVVSKRELGKLMRQMAEDSAFAPKQKNIVTTFAQTMEQNAKRTVTSNPTGWTSEKTKDAMALEGTIQKLIDTDGATKEQDNVNGVSGNELKNALKKWQFNEPGFKAAINELMGAEVLGEEDVSVAEAAKAIRTRAREMHKENIELVSSIVDDTMLEQADEQETEEDFAEDVKRIEGEAVAETVEPETTEGAPAPDIETLAQQTEQAAQEKADRVGMANRDADLLEEEAAEAEKEGRTGAAEELRAEAEEMRQRAQLDDNDEEERVFFGEKGEKGKLYTKDELFEYLQTRPNLDEKYKTREASDALFKDIQRMNTESARRYRASLPNGYSGNTEVSVGKDVELTDTQAYMANIIVSATSGTGIKRVRYESDAALGGSNGYYEGDTVVLNASKMNTQQALNFVTGHEFVHDGSEQIAKSAGMDVESEARDAFTEATILKIQDVVTNMYDANPDDAAAKALYFKYKLNFNNLIEQRYRAEKHFRVDVNGEDPVEVEKMLRDRNSALLKEEVVADWVGELAGQQELLTRMAKDGPGLVYQLYRTTSKIRRRMAGLNVPILPGVNVNVTNKEFINVIEGMNDSLIAAMRSAYEENTAEIQENIGTATEEEMVQSSRRLSLSPSAYNENMGENFYREYTDVKDQLRKATSEEERTRLQQRMADMEDSYYRDQRTREEFENGQRPGYAEAKSEKAQDEDWYNMTMELYGMGNGDYQKSLDLFGWDNSIYRYNVPVILSTVGFRKDTPLALDSITAIEAMTDFYTGKHSMAHNLGPDAAARAPEYINNAFFIMNSLRLDSNPAKTANGKPNVLVLSSELDENTGGVIVYAIAPSVARRMATFSGVTNNPANFIQSIAPRVNVFGEYTQYDAQLDAMIDELITNPDMEHAEVAKRIHELNQYRSTELLKNLLNNEKVGDKYLTPTFYSSSGTPRFAPEETGLIAEAIRQNESLYSNEARMNGVVQKMNEWRENWWEKVAQEANARGEAIPPFPEQIQLPERTLYRTGLPRTGNHQRANIPYASGLLNNTEVDKANGDFNGRSAEAEPKRKFSIDANGYVDGFYSELQNTIEGSKQNKMKPAQWLQYAKGHGQVKQEEIDYSGILDLPDESITKEDLLDYLRANEIQLEEEVLGDGTGNPERLDSYTYENTETGDAYNYDELVEHINDVERTTSVEELLVDVMAEDELSRDLFDRDREPIDSDPDNYDFYITHDLDYNDKILSTEAVVYHKTDDKSYTVPLEFFEATNTNTSRWGMHATDGNTNYREILLKIPNNDYTNQSMEAHWLRGRTGVLAHARVDDFTNKAEDKILFVEEIQSDWHNAGQKRGYEGPVTDSRKEEIVKELADIRADPAWHAPEAKELDDFLSKNGFGLKDTIRWSDSFQDFVDTILRDFIRSGSPAEDFPFSHDSLEKIYYELAPKEERIRDLEIEYEHKNQVAPDAPYKDSYVSLVLKRLLKEAVEKGYDRLAWTTAEMQSDRWSEAYAEGYRIEYDQQIPKFLNKYTKKWGAKVETTDLVSYETGEPALATKLREDGFPLWRDDFEETPIQVLSIPITDKMRESIKTKGQPRFSIDSNGYVDGFYSELQNTISGSKQNKMKPAQWLQYAKGHGQVKQEEIDYSGIMSLPDESITKEDLLDYLRANEIQLEEEVLEDKRSDSDEPAYYVDGETGELLTIDEILAEAESRDVSPDTVRFYLKEAGNAWRVGLSRLPSFSPEDYTVDYSLYGADGGIVDLVANLRYVGSEPAYLVDSIPVITYNPYDYSYEENEERTPRWGEHTFPGNTNYREILLKIPNSDYTNEAMRAHWGEERTGVLAHARVDDFTNSDGDKILFVEEIQSDWHNAGHNVGYGENGRAEKAKQVGAEIDKILAKPEWTTDKAQTVIQWFDGDERLLDFVDAVARLRDADAFLNDIRRHEKSSGNYLPDEITNEDIAKIYTDTKADATRIRKLEGQRLDILDANDVDDAPFKESYVSLALKRLLTEAVEKGYDRLAWTDSDMQADRWSRKYIEGYRIEYDQMIPNFLSKYVKKWGSKVEKTVLYETKFGENTYMDVLSIPITDAMRESIKTKGQPRFSLTDEQYESRIQELSDRVDQLTAQLDMNISERARAATQEELGEAQDVRDAVEYAHAANEVANMEGGGNIVDVGTARTSSIEDIISTVLSSPDSNLSMTTGELVNTVYHSVGYRSNETPTRARTAQSRVNKNTFTRTKMFETVTRTMEDTNARIKAQSAATRLQNEGEYDIVTEQRSMEEASQRLNEDFNGERERFETNNDEMSGVDLDVAMGILSVDLASGDTEQFMHTARLIQERATTAGQFIQAFAKYARTPEGVLVEALNDLERANLKPDKRAQLVEAMTDLAQTLESMREGDMEGIIDVIKRQAKIRKTRVSRAVERDLHESNWQTNYDRAMAQLRMIPRDYIASSLGEKLSTYQVLSHLLNARTGMRNVVANTVFQEVDSLLANNVAWAFDKILSVFTGKQTVGLQGGVLTGQGKLRGAIHGAREEAINVSLDIDPYDRATKYGNSKRTFHMTGGLASKGMSTLEKMLGYELNVTDEFSKGFIHTQVLNSLRPMVKAGLMTQEQAEDFAQQEMLYRTFQDETLIGWFLGKIHTGGNVIGIGKTNRIEGKTGKLQVHAFGLGDFVQKYTTVPGALMTRAFEFSPVGYLGLIHNVAVLNEARKDLNLEKKKSKPNEKKIARMEMDLMAAQRQTALAFGRATTGSGLITLFTFLALSGIINEEDKGEKTADKNYESIRGLEGLTGTQMNVTALQRLMKGDTIDEAGKLHEGDVLMDIAFLEPFNSLLSIGAILAGTQEAFDLKETLKGLPINTAQGLWNGLTDLPTMQTIRSVQQTIQYHQEDSPIPVIGEIGLEVLSGSLTGFVPAPVRQYAQAQDEYYRETYATTDPIQQMRDAFLNSVPGKREDLQTKLTPLGQDKPQEPELVRRLNAFVNPGTLHTYKPTALYDFLEDSAASTASKSFYPERNAPYKTTKTVDGIETEFELNAEQRRTYQTLRGQAYERLMTQAMDSKAYGNMATEDKKEALSTIKSLANYIALKDYLMNEQGWTEEDAIGTSSTYKSYEKTLQAVNLGFNPVDWTYYKQTAYAQEGEKDANGKTKDGTKKKAVISYISSLPLTDTQKSYLFLNEGNNYSKGNPWAGK